MLREKDSAGGGALLEPCLVDSRGVVPGGVVRLIPAVGKIIVLQQVLRQLIGDLQSAAIVEVVGVVVVGGKINLCYII